MNKIFSLPLVVSFFCILLIPLPYSSAFVRSTTQSTGTPIFWPNAGTELNLIVGCPPNQPLVHWGPCWNDAALDAATSWHVSGSQFRFQNRASTVLTESCDRDGLQTVSFRPSVCGLSFGNAVAVTFYLVNGSTGAFVEADTAFDANRQWSTYPGPIRFDGSGTPVFDLHRVAIHEFGHIIGLDHPDDHGQTVQAIMNRSVSNTDALQADDIAGIRAIYPDTSTPPRGVLENPKPGSFLSGIGTVSGWVCAASRVDLQVDGAIVRQAPYGSLRDDTQSDCGDANNGFGYLVNWNDLSPGQHTLVVLADGIEFGRATFTVSTFGVPFVTGASGTYTVPFNGRNVTIEWQESLQNFVIRNIQ